MAVPEKMVKRLGKGTMLIPRPLDVDALMRKIKKGKLATQSLMREKLARDFGADVTCPITTGIFVRIAAEAAEEQWRAGKKRVTPYWRVVRDDGSLNPKLPGGAAAQAARLKYEGHRIEAASGKHPPKVKNLQENLTQF